MEEKNNFIGRIDKKLVFKESIKNFIILLFIEFYILSVYYYYVGYLILFGIFGVFWIIFVPFYFNAFVNNFTYEITNEFVKINWGVFTHTKMTIPFNRIQNISVSNGVFDRIFNLNTIKIETAGFNGSSIMFGMLRSEGYIPGLKDPNKLEELINKLKIQ